jgi:GH15 family glucan-1,4-alpha-glucosidase
VQSKGTKDLDAATLLMPMMRFISPADPMWLSTMKAIEEHLSKIRSYAAMKLSTPRWTASRE